MKIYIFSQEKSYILRALPEENMALLGEEIFIFLGHSCNKRFFMILQKTMISYNRLLFQEQ